ncbi:MAG: hypothetical protein Q9213_007219, partial [Squamulea squamosa]
LHLSIPSPLTPIPISYITPPIPDSPNSKAYQYGLPILVLTELDAVVYDPSGKEVVSTVTTVQKAPGATAVADDGGDAHGGPYLRNAWGDWTKAERAGVIAGIVVAVGCTMGMLVWLCCRSRAWGNRGERKRRRRRMRERGRWMGKGRKSGKEEKDEEVQKDVELESDPGGKEGGKRSPRRVEAPEISVPRGDPQTVQEELNSAPADRGREPTEESYQMSGALQFSRSPTPMQPRPPVSAISNGFEGHQDPEAGSKTSGSGWFSNMAPPNDLTPASTTNVILGVTLSFGIVALVLGLYFIYKAYMRRWKHQQTVNPQPFQGSQRPTSAMGTRDRTLPRDRHPNSRLKETGSAMDEREGRSVTDNGKIGRGLGNDNSMYPFKQRREGPRVRQTNPRQRSDSIYEKRKERISPVIRTRKAQPERQDRRARSFDQRPFYGDVYGPSGLQSSEQYPGHGRFNRQRNVDPVRHSYPTQLDSTAVPRGHDPFEQDWTHISSEDQYRPKPADGNFAPTTTAAMPSVNMPQRREAVHSARLKGHLYPDFPYQRHGTPANPASEVSHLISALDTESIRVGGTRRMDHMSDAGHSHPSAGNRVDHRSSASDKGGFHRGDEQGSWLGRSSGIGSFEERSHRGNISSDSARASTVYDEDDKSDDKDDRGIHEPPQGGGMPNGHQEPNNANNETW